MEPLAKPPEEEEGDDSVAGGGTPKMVEIKEKDLGDASDLDEDDDVEDEVDVL